MATKMTLDAEKQHRSAKKNPTPASWKKGQSGNPKGRPADREYQEAVAMLKAKSPTLMKKAINMALDGSEKVMVAILSKICPDKLELESGKDGVIFRVIYEKKRISELDD
jgi:hypothetical protein